jgi:hypothetical protein
MASSLAMRTGVGQKPVGYVARGGLELTQGVLGAGARDEDIGEKRFADGDGHVQQASYLT